MRKHLGIEVDAKKLQLVFVGCEKEEDATWVYLEATCINPPKNIKIENNLLYEYLPEQTNILHVTINSDRKSFKLQNPEKEAVFVF